MKMRLLTSLALPILLGACASAGWQVPAVALPAQWQSASASTPAPAATDVAIDPLIDPAADQSFWLGFADPQLIALQGSARAHNADLALAAIRLRQAGFAVDKAGLARRPNASLGLNQGASWALDPARYRGESGSASLGFSWEVDLWGKLADQQQAARWREQASAAELAALQLTVATSVASAYWAIARDQDALQLAQDDLQRARETQSMVERRYSAGVVSGLDLNQARSNTTQQENALAQAQLALAKSRWQLGVLLGQAPQAGAEIAAMLPEQFPAIALGLPAEVLDHRPDLAAATARLQASFADLQVARKNWYPALSLTSSLGGSSQQLLSFIANPVASLGAGLALPFIQFNEMALARKSSAADYEAAVIEYRQKLYLALQEVESALASRTQWQAQVPRLQSIASETRQVEQQTRLRYAAGAVAFDAVLNASARRQAAEHALVLQRYQLALASVEVYKALGGAPLSP
ncbi:efflux transporter outer membrane subunit [Chitinibacter sp. FCG-7]|uniref:Efflux transporter outer membrane subunit n=1 Tax=Chitinibacter mangrovi TaxID=3153927 RepID=A0AAU7F6D4_9NEIS